MEKERGLTISDIIANDRERAEQLLRYFEQAKPRVTPEEEEENRQKIRNYLQSRRPQSIKQRFVVEGATVVCTQMNLPLGPRVIQGSVSRMKRLDDETSELRMKAITKANPHLSGKEQIDMEQAHQNTINAKLATKNMKSQEEILIKRASPLPKLTMMLNGATPLTPFDIEFSPLFTDQVTADSRKTEMLSEERSGVQLGLRRVDRPVESDMFQKFMSQLEGCNGCKIAADNRCKPKIERLMWFGADEEVNVSGANTLLFSDAYMVCHPEPNEGETAKSGILYIEESGQVNHTIADTWNSQWDELVEEIDDDIWKTFFRKADSFTDQQLEEEIRNNLLTRQTWDWFINAGYSEIQVASIMGNMQAESGFNPALIEVPHTAAGDGIGLVQWSFGRRTALENFALNRGSHWTNFEIQLEWLQMEMEGVSPASRQWGDYSDNRIPIFIPYDNAKGRWLEADNISDATEIFMFHLLRPSYNHRHWTRRLYSAYGYLALFGGR